MSSPALAAPGAVEAAPPQGRLQAAPVTRPEVRETRPVEPEKKKPKKTLKVKARVFARGALARQDRLVVGGDGVARQESVTSLDLLVESARVGVEYQPPSIPWLAAEVELEATGRPDLRDAFIKAEEDHFEIKAGQFKMPVSAIEMESIWKLPLVERGFINTLIIDRLDISGRRPGVTATLQHKKGIKPAFTLGVFQGSVLTEQTADDRETELAVGQGTRTLSPLARAQLKVLGAKLGLVYQHRVGAPAFRQTEHYPTFGFDLEWDRNFAGGGVRVYADVMAGTSWYEHPSKPVDDADAWFVSAQAVAGYRFGGVERGDFYVEPAVLIGALDPDTDVTSDLAWELGVGVNAGLWERARLTLQGQHSGVRRNFPSSYSLGADPDRLALLLQCGVSF